jgi:hypothetical protein
MAKKVPPLHDASMYTSLKRPRLGDRVRLTGFLGVFEVVRVRPDGSLVDLKHLDLHKTAYIEQEVSTHDLIYVRGPQSLDSAARPAVQTAAAAVRPPAVTAGQPLHHRSTAPGSYPQRTAARPFSSGPALANSAARRRDS